MAKDQFARLVRFARRTGDRLIVTDPDGEEPVVILTLEEYEGLVDSALGPTEEDMPFATELDREETPPATADFPPLEVLEEPREVAEEPPKIPLESSKEEPKSMKGEEQFYLEPL